MGIVQIGSVTNVGADVTNAHSVQVDGRQGVTQATEGSYRISITSGDLGAAATKIPFEFRNANTSKSVILHSVSYSAASNGTGFAAGLFYMQLFKLRTHTVIATGGTAVAMTTLMGKCRFGQADPGALIQRADTTDLTIGSGATADTNPFAIGPIHTVTTATVTSVTGNAPVELYNEGKFPMIFAPNEGFTMRNVNPGTGVWICKTNLVWSEVTV